MKRLSLVAAVAVAFAACGETPAPTEMDLPAAFAPGGNGVVASARGSGNLFAPGEGKGRVFAFNAKQQADGTVSGHINLNLANGVHVMAEVTCLRIDGNTAYVGGVNIKNSTRAGEVGFIAIDNGQGKNAAPDQLTLAFTQLPEGWAQDVCDGNLIPGGGGDTFRGNIQVD